MQFISKGPSSPNCAMILHICFFFLITTFSTFSIFSLSNILKYIFPCNYCYFIPPFCASVWYRETSALIPWPMTSFCLFLVTLPFFFYLTLHDLFLSCEASVFPLLTQIFFLSLRSWCPSLTFVCSAFFTVLLCYTQMSCFSSPVVICVWTVTQYYSAAFFLSHCIPKRSHMVVLVSVTLAFHVLFLALYYFILFNRLLAINFYNS